MDGDELATLLRYDDLCARIYADPRMTPGTREIALALTWVGLRDPEGALREGVLRRVAYVLGRDDTGLWRHKLLLAGDAPRYVEPDRLLYGVCEGPRSRPRRSQPGRPHSRDDDLVCGADGTRSVAERDLVTGQVSRRHWFCRRHAEHAVRVRAQIEAAGEPPPPIPNTGGVLPCYFTADWERLYRWASPGWVPPYHGVCADEWPVSGLAVVPRRPRLALVVNNTQEARS